MYLRGRWLRSINYWLSTVLGSVLRARRAWGIRVRSGTRGYTKGRWVHLRTKRKRMLGHVFCGNET